MTGYGRKEAGKRRTYTGEYKLLVINDLIDDKLSYIETGRKYEISDTVIRNWERIYLEEGAEGLNIERRGRNSKAGNSSIGRPRKMDKKVEEDLIAEVQRLRMENAYLKKLNALVQQREESEKKTRLK